MCKPALLCFLLNPAAKKHSQMTLANLHWVSLLLELWLKLVYAA